MQIHRTAARVDVHYCGVVVWRVVTRMKWNEALVETD
jgi:hypothetical protein